jgi:hypothetical protein
MSPTARKPLSYIRFTYPVILQGTNLPVSTWEQGRRKVEWPKGYKSPQAWLDLDRGEIVIGPDIFPHAGGLISHYRYARIATSPYKNEGEGTATE